MAGVNLVIFEISEIEDDKVDGIAVIDVNVGDTTSDDISGEKVFANEFGDATANDVAVVEGGVGDEVVNVVIGDEEIVVNGWSKIFSDVSIFGDVVIEDLDDVCLEEISVSNVIVDASEQVDVTVFNGHDNESRDSNKTTGESFDSRDNVIVEDVSSVTIEELEVGESAQLMKTVSVFGFDSVGNVSLLFESSMLVLRC